MPSQAHDSRLKAKFNGFFMQSPSSQDSGTEPVGSRNLRIRRQPGRGSLQKLSATQDILMAAFSTRAKNSHSRVCRFGQRKLRFGLVCSYKRLILKICKLAKKVVKINSKTNVSEKVAIVSCCSLIGKHRKKILTMGSRFLSLTKIIRMVSKI